MEMTGGMKGDDGVGAYLGVVVGRALPHELVVLYHGGPLPLGGLRLVLVLLLLIVGVTLLLVGLLIAGVQGIVPSRIVQPAGCERLRVVVRRRAGHRARLPCRYVRCCGRERGGGR